MHALLAAFGVAAVVAASPVLSVAETSQHPHHVTRGSLPVMSGARKIPAAR
jgi:crotonobetainyl-CoA:carnitine CoA-transferase CaiB-like acyl-CoA transferase